MSRIGNMLITVPAGVKVTIDGSHIEVTGPKGTLKRDIHPEMLIKMEGDVITVSRPSDEPKHKALHGLTRTLVANMVEGVHTGFSKKLQINGVGYRVQKQGKTVVMNLGFSHQVVISENEDITLDVPDANTIIVNGADKQIVGQYAAEVREKRPPEPYKGKGIKYETEVIRRKEGKAGKGAKK
ncbi:MAG: 50S ribosomal protein L6 [Clostridia bacterium]